MDYIKVEAYIHQYLIHFKPYKNGDWCYEDGIILSGAWCMFQVTQESTYADFVECYLNHHIGQNGSLQGYEQMQYNIDNINSGKVLFDLYERTACNNYLEAMHRLFKQLENHPRTVCGSFWHKHQYPYQIWLDGLYMAQPFYGRYILDIKKENDFSDILRQFQNVREYLFDETSGLYCHAYDETKSMNWADATTGKSPNIWSRSVGWYAMALVDVLEIVEADQNIKEILIGYLKELIDGMMPYQSKDGMWFQVVDQANYEGNYEETSGTLMMAYAILKGTRLSYLEVDYKQVGLSAFDGTLNKYLVEDKNGLHLNGICEVAGLDGKKRDGSIAYYLSEPVTADEAKGVAPLLMAFSEILQI